MVLYEHLQGVSIFAINAFRPRQKMMRQGVKLFCNWHG